MGVIKYLEIRRAECFRDLCHVRQEFRMLKWQILTLARTASSMGVIDDADMVEERLNNERRFRRNIDITHLWKLVLYNVA